jgi:glycosyltransferase involved in cell wall biosynthesis
MSPHQASITPLEPAPGVNPGAEPRPRNLRVLTLTPFYPSAVDRAQGGFIAEPLNGMTRCGISSEVIAVQPFYRGRAHSLQSEISSDWKTYFSLPGNLGLPTAGNFLAARLMPAVRRMHRLQRFDLIHAHSALPCGHAAALLSVRLAIPFVVSVHGLDAFSTRQAAGAIGVWCQRISQRVYRSARVVICISDRVQECVTQAVSANTVVVYNGVDPEFFIPALPSKPEAQSPLIVLSVGNLIPIKGHQLLLRSFVRCVNLVPGCLLELEIIGDGPQRGDLERLAAKLGIARQVRFLGRQGREAVAEAMRRCAVFALPSHYEGLGCVYLEAMASAKPAVACRGQGIDELIEHGKNGWLVSPSSSLESEIELSDSLSRLLRNHELRRRLGNAARNTVLQRHTLAHQSRQLAEIYRECAS